MAMAVLQPSSDSKERVEDNLGLEGAGAKDDPSLTPMSSQHVVFLDVDGVVNDLNTPIAKAREGGEHIQFTSKAHGNEYLIQLPKAIIEHVQYLVDHYEVYWLTTWREYANNEIRENLGIKLLPVITDGTDQRHVGWKWHAATPYATRFIAQGKHVYWIEDFYGHYGEYHHEVFEDDRFHFVDTWGCLQEGHLKEAGLL